MKILMVCDHYPLSPRVKKMRNSIKKLYPDSIIKVFAWNRSDKKVNEDYVVAYNQNLGYGNKLKKLMNIKKFINECKKFNKRFNPDYIHLIDIQMLISSLFINKEFKLIYEVYDIKFFRNKILNKIREIVEFYIIKQKVNHIILASPYFKIYYEKNIIKHVKKTIINNKPNDKFNLNINSNNYFEKKYRNILKDKIVIGFIGTIRYKHILMNLITSSEKTDDKIILLAGDGPDFDYIKGYINEHKINKKIIMTGRYSVTDLPEIYELCDYIWASYPNKDLNVKYAISNKFFESIVFQKKIIVSKDTMLGNLVQNKNLGYVVNPYNKKEIIELIKKLDGNYKFNNTSNIKENLFWEDEEYRLLKVYN